MATITTDTTLRFDAAASLTIAVDRSYEGQIAFTSNAENVHPSFTVTSPQSKTYGPFGVPMVAVITVSGGSLDYTINGGMGGFGYDANGNVTSLVSADGNAYPLRPSPDKALNVVLLGDSLTRYNSYAYAAVSCVRSGGIVTVTQASHGLWTNAEIRVKNASDASGDTEGAVAVTRVSSSTFTYASAGADGAFTANVDVVNWNSDQGWFNYANYSLGCPFNVVNNAGVSANTVSQMYDRLSVDVVAYSPGWVFVMAGTNDVLNGSALAGILTDLERLYDALRLMGARLVICSPPPVRSDYPITSTIALKLAEIRDYNSAYCASFGLTHVDIYGAVVDPTLSTGAAKSNYLSDTVHWSALGAQAAGAALASALSGKVSAARLLVASNSDNYAANASSSNLWEFAPWTNSGGLITGAGASGTIPTGWEAVAAGSSTVVASAPARSDGFGYDAQCVMTGGANNDNAVMRWRSTSSIHGRAVASGRYFCEAAASISGVSAGNIKYMLIDVSATYDGITVYLGQCLYQSVTTFAALDFASGTVMRTPEFTLPPFASLTDLRFEVRLVFSGVGSAVTVKAGRVSFRAVT